MNYYLIKETKDKVDILEMGGKYNLLHKMEYIIFNFLITKQDEDRAMMKPLRNPSHINSRTFNKYPYGYFQCYDKYNEDKRIVYHKYKGWFFNTVTQIFTLKIVKCKTKTDIVPFIVQPSDEFIKEFDECLTEIERQSERKNKSTIFTI